MSLITIVPALFEYELSDTPDPGNVVLKEVAEQLFRFFTTHELFKWKERHNGCEARADAVCVLLEAWGISSYKGWVFSGKYLKGHVGGLKQHWNYHVAPLLQVQEGNNIVQYILDPASADKLQPLAEWAAGVTEYPHSYYMIKESELYIFSDKKITRNNWHHRNRQNRKWMIQGIAGINSLNAKGKAELCFNKGRIRNTYRRFEALRLHQPEGLHI